jgi:hypothetical protein
MMINRTGMTTTTSSMSTTATAISAGPVGSASLSASSAPAPSSAPSSTSSAHTSTSSTAATKEEKHTNTVTKETKEVNQEDQSLFLTLCISSKKKSTDVLNTKINLRFAPSDIKDLFSQIESSFNISPDQCELVCFQPIDCIMTNRPNTWNDFLDKITSDQTIDLSLNVFMMRTQEMKMTDERHSRGRRKRGIDFPYPEFVSDADSDFIEPLRTRSKPNPQLMDGDVDMVPVATTSGIVNSCQSNALLINSMNTEILRNFPQLQCAYSVAEQIFRYSFEMQQFITLLQSSDMKKETMERGQKLTQQYDHPSASADAKLLLRTQMWVVVLSAFPSMQQNDRLLQHQSVVLDLFMSVWKQGLLGLPTPVKNTIGSNSM